MNSASTRLRWAMSYYELDLKEAPRYSPKSSTHTHIFHLNRVFIPSISGMLALSLAEYLDNLPEPAPFCCCSHVASFPDISRCFASAIAKTITVRSKSDTGHFSVSAFGPNQSNSSASVAVPCSGWETHICQSLQHHS